MRNADMPAMPHTTWDNDVEQVVSQGNGLTKREYFAAMSLPRIEVLSYSDTADKTEAAREAARMAVVTADELLAELERTQ